MVQFFLLNRYLSFGSLKEWLRYIFPPLTYFSYLPPLLVQRCNGTTAGLGYLEVSELSTEILLLEQLAIVRTVNSQWGRRIEFLY
jgi:hypothetical protein